MCGIVETIAKSATRRSAPGRERIPDNARRARVRSYEGAMVGLVAVIGAMA
ncbi:hypothetical protein XAPC_4108 [Xanthomonas citri pv. punicae str. LMG 859]|nr:hypothetical protein XAPC_4108 [Xanthomonas citri pv. punicae str. LMG 859]